MTEILKYINPMIFIDDSVHEEKFKQVYHFKEKNGKNSGIYYPYIINSFGRVFSINYGGRKNYIREMKISLNKLGYVIVVMTLDTIPVTVPVHRLVGISFFKWI